MAYGAVYNKDSFLNQVTKSLGRERITAPIVRPHWKQRPQWDILKGKSQNELLDVLRDQCERIHTQLEIATIATLNAVLKDVVARYNAKTIISWDDPRFLIYGINRYYEQAISKGIDVHVWDTSIGVENVNIAEKSDIGITFADMTLAESGTVVLFSAKGKGRSVSLLPMFYIAIIPKSTIVPRMTQAAHHIHKIAEQGKVPSCINFISGPSNSADIEMNLVVGVHGPIKATYIVVEDK